MKYLFVFQLITLLMCTNAYSGDFFGNRSICPALEFENFSGDASQFMVSNCFYQIKSSSHFTDFKFIDLGIGSRARKSDKPEVIGKFTFLSGNFWNQMPIAPSLDSKSIMNNFIYKIGFNLINLNTGGFFSFEGDIFSINADICYNPNDAHGSFTKPNTYARIGPVFKLSPHLGFSVINIDSLSLTNQRAKIPTDTIEGMNVGINLYAAYYFADDYHISVSGGYSGILTDDLFLERRISLRLSKEFYIDLFVAKEKEPRNKALELYCQYNQSNYSIHLNKSMISSLSIGASLYNYGEYLNAWEAIKHLN